MVQTNIQQITQLEQTIKNRQEKIQTRAREIQEQINKQQEITTIKAIQSQQAKKQAEKNIQINQRKTRANLYKARSEKPYIYKFEKTYNEFLTEQQKLKDIYEKGQQELEQYQQEFTKDYTQYQQAINEYNTNIQNTPTKRQTRPWTPKTKKTTTQTKTNVGQTKTTPTIIPKSEIKIYTPQNTTELFNPNYQLTKPITKKETLETKLFKKQYKTSSPTNLFITVAGDIITYTGEKVGQITYPETVKIAKQLKKEHPELKKAIETPTKQQYDQQKLASTTTQDYYKNYPGTLPIIAGIRQGIKGFAQNPSYFIPPLAATQFTGQTIQTKGGNIVEMGKGIYENPLEKGAELGTYIVGPGIAKGTIKTGKIGYDVMTKDYYPGWTLNPRPKYTFKPYEQVANPKTPPRIKETAIPLLEKTKWNTLKPKEIKLPERTNQEIGTKKFLQQNENIGLHGSRSYLSQIKEPYEIGKDFDFKVIYKPTEYFKKLEIAKQKAETWTKDTQLKNYKIYKKGNMIFVSAKDGTRAQFHPIREGTVPFIKTGENIKLEEFHYNMHWFWKNVQNPKEKFKRIPKDMEKMELIVKKHSNLDPKEIFTYEDIAYHTGKTKPFIKKGEFKPQQQTPSKWEKTSGQANQPITYFGQNELIETFKKGSSDVLMLKNRKIIRVKDLPERFQKPAKTQQQAINQIQNYLSYLNKNHQGEIVPSPQTITSRTFQGKKTANPEVEWIVYGNIKNLKTTGWSIDPMAKWGNQKVLSIITDTPKQGKSIPQRMLKRAKEFNKQLGEKGELRRIKEKPKFNEMGYPIYKPTQKGTYYTQQNRPTYYPPPYKTPKYPPYIPPTKRPTYIPPTYTPPPTYDTPPYNPPYYPPTEYTPYYTTPYTTPTITTTGIPSTKLKETTTKPITTPIETKNIQGYKIVTGLQGETYILPELYLTRQGATETAMQYTDEEPTTQFTIKKGNQGRITQPKKYKQYNKFYINKSGAWTEKQKHWQDTPKEKNFNMMKYYYKQKGAMK